MNNMNMHAPQQQINTNQNINQNYQAQQGNMQNAQQNHGQNHDPFLDELKDLWVLPQKKLQVTFILKYRFKTTKFS